MYIVQTRQLIVNAALLLRKNTAKIPLTLRDQAMHKIPELIDLVERQPKDFCTIFLQNGTMTGIMNRTQQFYIGQSRSFANAAGYKFISLLDDRDDTLPLIIIVTEVLDRLIYGLFKTAPCLPIKPGDIFLVNAMQV